MKSLNDLVAGRVKLGIKRIMVVVALVTLTSISVLTGKNAITSVRSESKLCTAEVDQVLGAKLSFIEAIARTLDSGVISNLNYQSYVNNLVTLHKDVSAVYICVPDNRSKYVDGITTYMSGGWNPPADFKVTEREWFKKGVEGDNTYVSAPYVDEQTSEVCVTMSHKVETLKGPGVVGLDLYLADLTELVSSMNNRQHSVSLVASDGTIILSQIKKLSLSPDSSTKLNDTHYKALGEDNKIKLLWDYKGGLKFGISNTSSITGWTVVYTSSLLYLLVYLMIYVVCINGIAWIAKKFASKRMLGDIEPMFTPLEEVASNIHFVKDGQLDFRLEQNDSSSDVHKVINSLNDAIDGFENYIGEINRIVSAVSNKDLTVGIETEFVGDYDKIKTSLEIVLTELNESFSELKENAATVLEYSRSLEDTSESVASAATLQSHAVSSATEELHKLSQSMADIHDLAERVKKSNDEANNQLSAGGSEMQALVNTIGEIVECFDGIAGFVSEIKEIASQTNLLSLNASIEAARAGESGKGFGVVAEEIQILSVNAASASSNISSFIEKTRKAVTNGKILVEKTQQTINLGVEYAVENSEMVEKIVDAVNDQKDSIKEISENFKEVSSMVESNAASAEENSAIATQLEQCAHTLASTVDEYRLK